MDMAKQARQAGIERAAVKDADIIRRQIEEERKIRNKSRHTNNGDKKGIGGNCDIKLSGPHSRDKKQIRGGMVKLPSGQLVLQSDDEDYDEYDDKNIDENIVCDVTHPLEAIKKERCEISMRTVTLSSGQKIQEPVFDDDLLNNTSMNESTSCQTNADHKTLQARESVIFDMSSMDPFTCMPLFTPNNTILNELISSSESSTGSIISSQSIQMPSNYLSIDHQMLRNNEKFGDGGDGSDDGGGHGGGNDNLGDNGYSLSRSADLPKFFYKPTAKAIVHDKMVKEDASIEEDIPQTSVYQGFDCSDIAKKVSLEEITATALPSPSGVATAGSQVDRDVDDIPVDGKIDVIDEVACSNNSESPELQMESLNSSDVLSDDSGSEDIVHSYKHESPQCGNPVHCIELSGSLEKSSEVKESLKKTRNRSITCKKCSLISVEDRPVYVKSLYLMDYYLKIHSAQNGVAYICFGEVHLLHQNGRWELVDDSELVNEYEDSWEIALESKRRKKYNINGIICTWVYAEKGKPSRWIVKIEQPCVWDHSDVIPERETIVGNVDRDPVAPIIGTIDHEPDEVQKIACEPIDDSSSTSNNNSCEETDFVLPSRPEPKPMLLPTFDLKVFKNKVAKKVNDIAGQITQHQIALTNESADSKTIKNVAQFDGMKENVIQAKQKASQKAKELVDSIINLQAKISLDAESDDCIMPDELIIVRNRYIIPMKGIIAKLCKLFEGKVDVNERYRVGDDFITPSLGWIIRSDLCTIFANFLSVGLMQRDNLLNSLFYKPTPITLWKLVKDFSLSFKRHEFVSVIQNIESSRLFLDDHARFRHFFCELLNRDSEDGSEKLMVTWFRLFPLSTNTVKFYKEHSFWRMNYNLVFGVLCEEIVLSLKQFNGLPFNLRIDFESRHMSSIEQDGNTNNNRHGNEVVYMLE